MHIALLFAFAVLVASHALAQEDCTDVNPGRYAHMCSVLEDNLQTALVQNSTNIYIIRKAFAPPTPSLLNVFYDITITNMPPEVQANYTCTGNASEMSNSSGVCKLVIMQDNIWTDVGLFKVLHPGLIQQLQLQLPYFMLTLAEMALKEDPINNFALSAAQWDGCSSTDVEHNLPNITLSLVINYDNLSHSPSEKLFNSSVQELTTWLRAFENMQQQAMPPERLPEIQKSFVIISNPIRPEHEDSIVGLEIAGLAIILVLSFLVLGGAKFNINTSKTKDDKFSRVTKFIKSIREPALLFVAAYNIMVLSVEFLSLTVRQYFVPAFGCFPFNKTHVVLFRCLISICTIMVIYIMSIAITLCKYHKLKEKSCLQSVFPAFSNCTIFVFIVFFSKSMVGAALLVYAYPFAVITTALLMIMTAIFLLLLFSYVFLALKTLKVREQICDILCCSEEQHAACYSRKWCKTLLTEPCPPMCHDSCCKCKLYYFIYIPICVFFCIVLIFLLSIGLLAPFAVAIVKRQVGVDGFKEIFISLFASVALGVASWVLKTKIPIPSATYNIVTSIGKTITLELEPGDNVNAVKAKIKENCGILQEEQLLTFNGYLLKDSDTLNDHDVGVLHLRDTMLVFVEIPTGKIITLEVKPIDKIEDVKDKIHDTLSILPDRQLLFTFHDRLLNDDDTLDGFNHATLHLFYYRRGRMLIFVKTLTGKIIPLQVKPSDTINKVKAKAKAKAKTKEEIPEKEALHINEANPLTLENENTLENIKEGTLLFYKITPC